MTAKKIYQVSLKLYLQQILTQINVEVKKEMVVLKNIDFFFLKEHQKNK